MSRLRRKGIAVEWLPVVLVMGGLLFAGSSEAQAPGESDSPAAEALSLDEEGRLPGVGLTVAITEVTGVAISPLLGVSSVGAWHYFKTPAEHRHRLPWFCHPAAWGIGMGLLLLVSLKDVIGTGAPVLIKKPLDVAELFESKASAAIASVGFMPFVADQVSRHFSAEGAALPEAAVMAGQSGGLVAAAPLVLADAGISPMWLLTPLLLIGFFVVWIVSHSVNVLILLSPFGFIDAGLKVFRLGVLASVAAISILQPVLGAILCLVIITFALFLAPWAFRLSMFGSVIAWDLARSLVWTSPAPKERVFGFLAHARGVRFPVRCRGWIDRGEDGELRFTRQSCLPGLKKQFRLARPPGIDLRRGLLCPSISRLDDEGQVAKPVVLLLPRYRPHLEDIASDFGVAEVGDSLLQRGFRGMIDWLKETAAIGHAKTRDFIESNGLLADSAKDNSERLS